MRNGERVIVQVLQPLSENKMLDSCLHVGNKCYCDVVEATFEQVWPSFVFVVAHNAKLLRFEGYGRNFLLAFHPSRSLILRGITVEDIFLMA